MAQQYSINSIVTITATNQAGTQSVTPVVKVSSLPVLNYNTNVFNMNADYISIEWSGDYVANVGLDCLGYSNIGGLPDRSYLTSSLHLSSTISPFIIRNNELVPNTFYDFTLTTSNIINTTGSVFTGYVDILTYPSAMSNLTLYNTPTYCVLNWENTIESAAILTMSNIAQNTSNTYDVAPYTSSNTLDSLQPNSPYYVSVQPYNVNNTTVPSKTNYANSSNIYFVTLPYFQPPSVYVTTSNIESRFTPSFNSYSNILISVHSNIATNANPNPSVSEMGFYTSNLIDYNTCNYTLSDLSENTTYSITYTPFNDVGNAGLSIQSNVTTLTSIGKLEYDTQQNLLEWGNALNSYSYVRISQQQKVNDVLVGPVSTTDKIYGTSMNITLTETDNVLLTVTSYNSADVEGQKRKIQLQQINSVYYVYNINTL